MKCLEDTPVVMCTPCSAQTKYIPVGCTTMDSHACLQERTLLPLTSPSLSVKRYPSTQYISSSLNLESIVNIPPLSIGFHDSSFHQLKIQPSFVRIIKRALGSRGSYAGGRCTHIHKGHLSFVGPRKVGRMNQPTVQEGPNEKSYWYHKEKNDHQFLPFVVSLVTILGGATSVAPHHFYWHFNQLYPHVNSTETRLKFCPRVILTVDF